MRRLCAWWAVVLNIGLTFGSAGAAGSASADSGAKDARGVAQVWLAALARGERSEVLQLLAPEVAVEGFDLAAGPERQRCARAFPATPNHRLRGSALTKELQERLVDCLLQDELLKDALSGDVRRRTLGRVRETSARKLGKRLRAFQLVVSKLAGPGAKVVELTPQEEDGVSVAVALVLVAAEGRLLVRGAFFDPRFVE